MTDFGRKHPRRLITLNIIAFIVFLTELGSKYLSTYYFTFGDRKVFLSFTQRSENLTEYLSLSKRELKITNIS